MTELEQIELEIKELNEQMLPLNKNSKEYVELLTKSNKLRRKAIKLDLGQVFDE